MIAESVSSSVIRKADLAPQVLRGDAAFDELITIPSVSTTYIINAASWDLAVFFKDKLIEYFSVIFLADFFNGALSSRSASFA